MFGRTGFLSGPAAAMRLKADGHPPLTRRGVSAWMSSGFARKNLP